MDIADDDFFYLYPAVLQSQQVQDFMLEGPVEDIAEYGGDNMHLLRQQEREYAQAMDIAADDDFHLLLQQPQELQDFVLASLPQDSLLEAQVVQDIAQHGYDDTYVVQELQLLEYDDFPRESAVQFDEFIRDGFTFEWPHVGAAGAPGDPALAVAVADALKTVEAPSDGLECPICLHHDDDGAWKETPCGHWFHGRCVERWLQDKGSCPMCRHQVVTMPAAAAAPAAATSTSTAGFSDLELAVVGFEDAIMEFMREGASYDR